MADAGFEGYSLSKDGSTLSVPSEYGPVELTSGPVFEELKAKYLAYRAKNPNFTQRVADTVDGVLGEGASKATAQALDKYGVPIPPLLKAGGTVMSDLAVGADPKHLQQRLDEHRQQESVVNGGPPGKEPSYPADVEMAIAKMKR